MAIELITVRVVDQSRKGEILRLFKQKEFLFSTRMTSLQVEEKYRIKGKIQNQGWMNGHWTERSVILAWNGLVTRMISDKFTLHFVQLPLLTIFKKISQNKPGSMYSDANKLSKF